MQYIYITLVSFSVITFGITSKAYAESDGAYEILPKILYTNAETSKRMMSRQSNVTDKAIVQLNAEQNGKMKPYRLYIGARAVGNLIYEKTNTDGKFPILSRLPPTHTRGDTDTYGFISDITATATLTSPWVTGFTQGEYTELAYPGQSRYQLKKYWLNFGNLKKTPFYATVGKKTVNFGNFDTYGPFTHTHSAHYFWAHTNKKPLLEVGYVNKRGTMLTTTVISNERGLRVLNSPKNNGKYENFALNFSQRVETSLQENSAITFGGGFLRGSIYDSTLAHHPPSEGLNDRFWNNLVNGSLEYNSNSFDTMIEYTQSLEDWPATGDQVKALTLQARYKDKIFSKPINYSLSYSRGEQGESGDEWRKMQQGIIGVEVDLFPHLSVGAEYMVNDGFVPLILPRITADDGVKSHSVIFGLKLSF